ncbi:hypothetical protein V6N11_032041 [Hibiscus sabdariffa]|uniref:Reverse transcriptase zinc-binding domain-containing protein n=1 Tax=Hibiscus sabdariffa TaxID=183260 RepID=A0ABR2T048_9ROSI
MYRDLSFVDLMTDVGTWDIPRLSMLFPESIITHIMAIKCPSSTDGNDMCMWRWTPKHTFELQSAYFVLSSSRWSQKRAIWPVIWKFNVPQRVRLFLWIAYEQRLMTNDERCRRTLSSNPSCLACSNPHETVLHVLRDCHCSRHLWLHFLPASLTHSFFSLNLQNWISCNLSSTFLHPQWNVSWCSLFASIISCSLVGARMVTGLWDL